MIAHFWLLNLESIVLWRNFNAKAQRHKDARKTDAGYLLPGTTEQSSSPGFAPPHLCSATYENRAI
jgi:hypothetical protein